MQEPLLAKKPQKLFPTRLHDESSEREIPPHPSQVTPRKSEGENSETVWMLLLAPGKSQTPDGLLEELEENTYNPQSLVYSKPYYMLNCVYLLSDVGTFSLFLTLCLHSGFLLLGLSPMLLNLWDKGFEE
ncbi:hypothetical protein STEG23_015410, partial [Scotinomys teguina]